MNIQTTRRKNLQTLVGTFGLAHVAKKAKKPDSQINDMLAGRKSFGEKVAREIEANLGLAHLYLDEDQNALPSLVRETPAEYTTMPPDSDFVPVHRVKIKPSAGVTGYTVEDSGDIGKPIFFRADYLKSRNWNSRDLIAMRVNGASMEPGLYDNDLIVIHTAKTTPHEGHAFIIIYEGETIIKRLRRDQGAWWLSSDNQDKRRYPDKRMDDEHARIIGEVVYKQSEII